MKKIVLLIITVLICSSLLFLLDTNRYASYPNHIAQVKQVQDTVHIKQITLPQDSTLHKSIPKKEKRKKHVLKGRLKLTKRKSVKSREFGGIFIDESIMFRTR